MAVPPAGIGVLENHHETVAGRLVDVAAALEDLVEERAEVALDEPVHRRGVQASGQPRVAGDVDEQYRDVGLALGELGRVRRLLDQALHRARHELRQAGADRLENLHATQRRLQRVICACVLEGDGALRRNDAQVAQVVRSVRRAATPSTEDQQRGQAIAKDDRHCDVGLERVEVRQAGGADVLERGIGQERLA